MPNREIKVEEWFAKSLVVARRDDTRAGVRTRKGGAGELLGRLRAGYLG